MTTPEKEQAGFIQGRLFLSILGVVALTAGIYFGTIWGKEFYKIKMCETCTERMWLIEAAKKKYSANGHGKVSRYSELLPYLPFTGFPMCPFGGRYENELDLDKPVACTLNGNPDYEPKTPGIPLARNGYMDLAGKPKAVSFFDFFVTKAQKKQVDEKKKKSSLFSN